MITLESACKVLLNHFRLKVADVAADVERRKLSAPGSLLQVITYSDHPLADGAPREVVLLFSNGLTFRGQKGRTVLTYPSEGLLLTGWLLGEEYLREQAALGEVR